MQNLLFDEGVIVIVSTLKYAHMITETEKSLVQWAPVNSAVHSRTCQKSPVYSYISIWVYSESSYPNHSIKHTIKFAAVYVALQITSSISHYDQLHVMLDLTIT